MVITRSSNLDGLLLFMLIWAGVSLFSYAYESKVHNSRIDAQHNFIFSDIVADLKGMQSEHSLKAEVLYQKIKYDVFRGSYSEFTNSSPDSHIYKFIAAEDDVNVFAILSKSGQIIHKDNRSDFYYKAIFDEVIMSGHGLKSSKDKRSSAIYSGIFYKNNELSNLFVFKSLDQDKSDYFFLIGFKSFNSLSSSVFKDGNIIVSFKDGDSIKEISGTVQQRMTFPESVNRENVNDHASYRDFVRYYRSHFNAEKFHKIDSIFYKSNYSYFESEEGEYYSYFYNPFDGILESSEGGVFYLIRNEFLKEEITRFLWNIVVTTVFLFFAFVLFVWLRYNFLRLKDVGLQHTMAETISHTGSWNYDLISKELIWSDETYSIFNKKHPYIPTVSDFYCMIDKSDRRRVKIFLSQLLKDKTGKERQIKYKIQVGDSSKVVRQVCKTLVDSNNMGYTIIGVIKDITSSVYSRKELKDKQALVDLITEGGVLGTWDWDLKSHKIKFNKHWYDIVGLEPAIKLASITDWLRLVHEDDISRVNSLLNVDSMIKNRSFKFIHRLKHKDGSFRWVLTSGQVVKKTRGGIPLRIAGTQMDITKEKLAELSLLRERKLFETGPVIVLNILPENDWTVDFVSENINKFGYRRDEFDNQKVNYKDLIHPDDLVRVERHFNEQVKYAQDSLEQTYRIKNKNDEWVWVYDVTYPVYGEKNEVIFFTGYLLDFTRFKENESRLRQAAIVFDNTEEAIVVSDSDNKIISVNPSFTRITGYDQLDVIGHTPSFLNSNLQTNVFYEAMWAELNSGGRWQGEILSRKKNGDVFTKWLTISSVYDDEGRLEYYVAVFSDITKEKASREKLHYLAHFDALTGLPNRNLFKERLDEATQRAKRTGSQVVLMFIDLDRFKNVNDFLGHDVGDDLLVEVAGILKEAVRETDTVVRLGGDEFSIVFEGFEDVQYLKTKAQDLIHQISQPIITQSGHELLVGATIGIALYPQDGKTGTELLKNADAAMYRAKDKGRGCYEFYNADMALKASEVYSIESELKDALNGNEIKPYYQIQVELGTGRVVGVEALARWIHPERGMIPPDSFIGIAEDSGLIHKLGRKILEKSIQDMSMLRSLSIFDGRLAINISAHELSRVNFQKELKEIFEKMDFPSDLIELEITESCLMLDPQAIAEKLKEFKAMGVSIAIDDFGTGHSSLNRIKQMPLDVLKIDRSFTSDIMNDKDDLAIIRAIIAMGHSLELSIIAEGIETVEQAKFISKLGCKYGQGYYYGKPMSFDDLKSFLEDSHFNDSFATINR